MPEVHRELVEKEVSGELFSVQWFITLFAYDVPLHSLGVLWDLFFLKGWKFVFQVLLAILSCLPSHHSPDSETLIFRIKNVIRVEPIARLARKALKIKITNEELAKLEAQFNSIGKSCGQSNDLTEETKAEISDNKDNKNLNDSSEGSFDPVHKCYIEANLILKATEIGPMRQSLAYLKKSQYVVPKPLEPEEANSFIHRKQDNKFKSSQMLNVQQNNSIKANKYESVYLNPVRLKGSSRVNRSKRNKHFNKTNNH